MINTIILTLILFNQSQLIDSVAIFDFASTKATGIQAVKMTNMFRAELGKLIPVLTKEREESIGISSAMTLVDVTKLCREANISGVVGGKVKKISNKYRVQVIFHNFSNNRTDTIVTVNGDLSQSAQLLAKSIFHIKKGEEELEFGSIQIGTNPSGAEILLDGEYVGNTPTRLDLIPFGEHSILLSKKGYNTAIKLIVLYPGKISTLTETLIPITGTLLIPNDKMPVYLLDEVVVRGERIKEKLFETPKGVDIISRREIEYSGARDVPSLLSQVSGVSVVDPTGSGIFSSIKIRGMDPSKYTAVAIDGVVINDLDGKVNWSNVPIELVKRVEIIKSSLSTYGGKAAGGIVNIMTKEKEKNKFSISTTDGKDIGLGITFSASDVWSVWANTNGRKGRGWRDEETYDIRSFYAKSSFPMDRSSNIALSFDLQNNNITLPGGLTASEIATNPEAAGDDKEKKYQQTIRLSSQYMSEGKDYNFLLNFNAMPQTYDIELPLLKQRMNGINLSGNSSYKKDNFTLTSNVDWEFDRRRTTKNYIIPEKDTSADDNAQLINPRISMEWKEKFYGVSITPGINAEWVGYWFQNGAIGAPSPSYTSAFSPNLGFLIDAKGFDIFASFDRALRLPKPYEKVKNIELKPEFLSTSEAGIRIKKSNMNASISVFYIKIADQILADANTFTNYGNAFHRGIESAMDLRVTDAISLFSTYTTLEAKSLAEDDSTYFVPGNPFQEAEIGLRISKIPVFSLTGSYRWKGKSYIDYKNEFGTIPPYGTVDVTSKFIIRSNVSLTLGLNNLLDEKGKNFGYKLNNEARYYPIPPRGFRVEGGIDF
ncbi:MAG: TonB-dependent receptor [bacterium]